MNRRLFLQTVASTALATPLFTPVRAFAQDGSPVPGEECVPNEIDGACLQVAPMQSRVDLETPVFSNPAAITNPLFPISALTHVLQLGVEAGESLRVEATLMPETKLIAWNGQQVETVVSQFIAYLDGRVAELALDFFAQDDSGNVWYFGEDVFNYEDGLVANTSGTWLAGRDGVPGMIMPADPKAGNVYRPENIPGFVFEEVTVLAIDHLIDGPRGPIQGAIVVQELLMDGTHEEKVFAPAYGEFSAETEDEFVTLALALPVDFNSDSLPRALATLSSGAIVMFETSPDEEWERVDASLTEMNIAWDEYSAGSLPPVLKLQMDESFDAMTSAIEDRDVADCRQASLHLSRAVLDLHLQYRSVTDVDLDRIAVFAGQLLIDVAEGEPEGILSDITAIELIWARSGHNLESEQATQLQDLIDTLRTATDAGELATLFELVTELRAVLTED